MAVTVRIPNVLRTISLGKDIIQLDGSSLQDAIVELDSNYPGFRDRLCDESGEIRRFVNIYVNGEDVRFLDGLSTPLKAGDEVSIVPAVAGGC
jgi:molybdopterin synthase sulfur carrier subunit